MAAKTKKAGSVSLPLAPGAARGGCGTLRPSRMGRWRAAVLIGVHVLIAIHIAHWLTAGTTLTPLEPSESIQTLRDGLVNAGFVLFSLAILSTLLLGRFFCGWACHLVALQDLCTWLLAKIGLRPKPFRSRLLILVPLGAAIYMFIWPVAGRWLLPGITRWIDRTVYGITTLPDVAYVVPAPIYAAHFLTDDFWTTFPGWTIGTLTFVTCGFVIVYLLGNKGFCTYACPYGGFFGPADLITPGKIKVTDDCDGCGHCTATCTSNVRVHEEVRDFKMVVDPGCMKCLDCVSVCPKDALYFGMGRPSLFVKAPTFKRLPRRFDYSWGDELLMAAIFAVALFAFWGPIPFLFSLGCAVMCAFLFMQTFRLIRRSELRLHNFVLRRRSALTAAGWVFVALMLGLGALVGNLALVQGRLTFAQLALGNAERLQAANAGKETEEIRALTELGLRRLQAARAGSFFPLAPLEMRIGYLESYFGRHESARRHLTRALELAPRFAHARYEYSKLLALSGDLDTAIQELFTVMRDGPDLEAARRDLLTVLVNQNRLAEARAMLEDHLHRRPNSPAARLQLASLLRQEGNVEAAERQLRISLRQRPNSADAYLQLALTLFQAQRGDEALTAARRAAELAPTAPVVRQVLAELEQAVQAAKGAAPTTPAPAPSNSDAPPKR